MQLQYISFSELLMRVAYFATSCILSLGKSGRFPSRRIQRSNPIKISADHQEAGRWGIIPRLHSRKSPDFENGRETQSRDMPPYHPPFCIFLNHRSFFASLLKVQISTEFRTASDVLFSLYLFASSWLSSHAQQVEKKEKREILLRIPSCSTHLEKDPL